jgi:hypothetical protein
MGKLKKSLIISICVPLCIVGILVLWGILDITYYEFFFAPQLRHELGFSLGTPYIIIDNKMYEVTAFEDVKPGGIFDKAGIHNGDIPLGRTSNFYKMLERSRGRVITFEVVSWWDNGPILSRKKKNIKVFIPPR